MNFEESNKKEIILNNIRFAQSVSCLMENLTECLLPKSNLKKIKLET